MLTAELETPKLRRQIIDRVQTLASQALTKVLLFINNFNHQVVNDVDDDNVVIDLDFHTPQTPEEASREMDEIEEEFKQGKFITHEQGMAEIDRIIKKYEYSMV